MEKKKRCQQKARTKSNRSHLGPGFQRVRCAGVGGSDVLPHNRICEENVDAVNNLSCQGWDAQTLTKFLKRVGHHEKLGSQEASQGQTPLNMSFTPLLETQKGGKYVAPEVATRYEKESKYLSVCPLFPFLL